MFIQEKTPGSFNGVETLTVNWSHRNAVILSNNLPKNPCLDA